MITRRSDTYRILVTRISSTLMLVSEMATMIMLAMTATLLVLVMEVACSDNEQLTGRKKLRSNAASKGGSSNAKCRMPLEQRRFCQTCRELRRRRRCCRRARSGWRWPCSWTRSSTPTPSRTPTTSGCCRPPPTWVRRRAPSRSSSHLVDRQSPKQAPVIRKRWEWRRWECELLPWLGALCRRPVLCRKRCEHGAASLCN